MLVLKTEQLSIELNGNKIFENANIEISEGERVVLLGANGVGKTSFIKSILGTIPLSKGSIKYGIDENDIGWVVDEGTIVDPTITYIEKGNVECFKLKQNLIELAKQMEKYSTDEKIINLYNESLNQYLDLNGYEWEANIELMLNQFHVPKSVWCVPFSHLSGGQKTRVKLIKAMLKKPKLLVLDEPTNHLDSESIDWLANWLNQYKGSVLFISHERSFIDKVAHSTIEFTESGTKKYQGGYSSYKTQKEHENKTLNLQLEKQSKERKKLIEMIQSFKQWFHQADRSASVRDPYAQKKATKHISRIKSKEKALQKSESNRIEKPKEDKKISALFMNEPFLSRTMVKVENVTFQYENAYDLFKDVSLHVNRQDRIAVVGRNGTGKTTFLKLLCGQIKPTKGSIVHNPQLKIGYFMQELEGLSNNKTILSEIIGLPEMTESRARTILGCFLFYGDDVYKKISDLSMGERCRIAFVKLYFSDANLLVLDEPTNYLDIISREQIEEALAVYPGAIVIVSHDPYLLRKISNRVFKIEKGDIVDYKGSYKEWETYKYVKSNKQILENKKMLLQLELVNLMNAENVISKDEEQLQFQKIREVQTMLNDINEEMKNY
jgi:ATPase subunit of ABC transporter with duplicated ATPase domains